MIDHLLIALEITYRSWEIILWRQSQALNVLLRRHAPVSVGCTDRVTYALGRAFIEACGGHAVLNR
jgi:hypothetical protein